MLWRAFKFTKMPHFVGIKLFLLVLYCPFFGGVSFLIWVVPKIMVPQIIHLFIGFSIIFTIHFGGKPHYFLVQHPYLQPFPTKNAAFFVAHFVDWKLRPSHSLPYLTCGARGGGNLWRCDLWWRKNQRFWWFNFDIAAIASMYGICTYIWLMFLVNVGI